MPTTTQKWLPLVLIGGAVWFLTRDGRLAPAPPAGRDDLGGYDPILEPGMPRPQGLANVGGSLATIDVASRPGELGLHSHRLERKSGDGITVNVAWSNQTTDFQGANIAWPARLRVDLGHGTGFGFGGWDTMAELLGQGGSAVVTNLGAAPGAHNNPVSISLGNEPDPPQNWDVRVILEMQGSTSMGNPNGIWEKRAEEKHDNAVRIIPTSAPASVSGSVGTIGVVPGVGPGLGYPVNIPTTGSGGIDWGAGGFQNTPGARMRQLGMRAQRPPWGMVGHPDVRQWPVSNRNMLLPGVEVFVRQEGRISAGSVIGPGRRVYAV